ncbi:hypothetical protein SNE40_007123 [Patella caerulea]|uniref:INTS8 TPR repeats domain-containing protein n=1 Tax=Patella caerulea TaxID=87958 RepID=A0AAN8Q7V5_PATCE
MTDVQVPRGNCPGTVSLPSITWFEFLLDHELLQRHLEQDNPDPTAVQLIIQFLQQAEFEMMNIIQNKDIHPPTPGQSETNIVKDVTVERKTPDSDCPTEETRKVRGLKILALRVAAHLKWNLAQFDPRNSVPLPTMLTLLKELLSLCIEGGIDSAMNEDIDVTKLSDLGRFAVQLYHRWVVRSVINDSFPSRPLKLSFTVPPGQIDPVAAMVAANEVVINKLKEEKQTSITILQKFSQHSTRLDMPTPGVFIIPNECTEVLCDWSKCIKISCEEVKCQLSFDLGVVYFHQSVYTEAFEMFKQAQKMHTKLKDPVYCKLDVDRLRGYLTSCASLLGITMDAHQPTLFEQVEVSRKNNYKDIVNILLEDNIKQELSLVYRSNLEDDISKQGKSYNELFSQVCICNVVRGVLEGKALVSPIVEALEAANQILVQFLVQVLSDAIKSASFSQRSNLKCFVWHIAELVPQESGFIHAVLKSEIASYLDADEWSEMAVVDNPEQLYLQDIDMEEEDITLPAVREPTYDISNSEGKLLTVYDPDCIQELVLELCQKFNMTPNQVIHLNDKWKVPREIKKHLDIYSPQMNPKQAYVFVLIGKARHCTDLRIFDRARQLLTVADTAVADISYTLSKHIRWQILLTDLKQFYLNETFGEGSSLPDLNKKTKTCLTSVRLAQDIQPSSEVLEHCTGFLLNIRDWDYLTSMENTRNGYIELSRLLSCTCKELQNIKTARITARELWEAVLNIFTNITQHKRTSSGRDSTMQRESNTGLLSRDNFMSLFKKLKEPTILSLLLSMFTKLFTVLKDDVTTEITSEYLTLWPTAILNASAIDGGSISDVLTQLMQHSLEVNPTQPFWLRTQADIYFAHNQYSSAMKYYLECGVVATDYFSSPVPKTLYDDQVYRKMIKCCSYLQCHTQVAVLCGFLDEVDYGTAFKALQERTCYDAMDAYYPCIWDMAILEHLTHLHTKRGELEKCKAAMKAIGQMDVNCSNPEETLRRAVLTRKTKFLRALAKQYIT